MSLLGRLEDLSLADIIQIVYLSRRTGTLEIHDAHGEHTLAFRNGMLVDAASPGVPRFNQWLAEQGIDDAASAGTDVVAEAVRTRVVEIVRPLLEASEGEFRFVLADDAAPMTLDYDPSALFREGGLPPQRVLAAADRPLRALEETLKAGKALIKSAQNTAAFPAAPPPRVEPAPAEPSRDSPHFRVAGGLISVESPEARMRNVVLFERDAMIRVAAKRSFAKHDITIAQFSALDDVRRAVAEWFRTSAFFVTVLEVAEGSPALLRDIKRRNPGLPVAMIDVAADGDRRQELLRAGTDLVLVKPQSGREEDLAGFADDLVTFADSAFEQWDKLAGSWGAGAGKRFYDQAEQERTDRTFDILREFIAELSNPNDVAEIGATILRLARDYLDRAALFVVRSDYFVTAGDGSKIRIDRTEASILSEVADSCEPHRGKMKRTPANERLIAALGGALPTEVVALPIVHAGRTLGILYGDNAIHRTPIEQLTGLEVFLVQASFAFGSAVEASEFVTPT